MLKILQLFHQEQMQLTREIYWANVFRDTICDSEWLLKKSFSPGRWAVNYLALYLIFRILNDTKPHNILECGLGQSSKITIQFAEFYKSRLTIFEHNTNWIDFFSRSFAGAEKYIKQVELEQITVCGEASTSYAQFQDKIEGEKYDFVLIDGPVGTEHYSRPNILHVATHLARSFAIVFDDYERQGEQNTLKIFEEQLSRASIRYRKNIFSSDKSIALLCSPDLEFLMTV